MHWRFVFRRRLRIHRRLRWLILRSGLVVVHLKLLHCLLVRLEVYIIRSVFGETMTAYRPNRDILVALDVGPRMLQWMSQVMDVNFRLKPNG